MFFPACSSTFSVKGKLVLKSTPETPEAMRATVLKSMPGA